MKRHLTLLACLFASTAALAQDPAPVSTSTPCVSYTIQAYRGNTLLWEEAVSAPVDQAVPIVVSPQQAQGVGLVGFVWPMSSEEGVQTRYFLDADWAPNAADAATIEWHAEGTANLAMASSTNLHQQVGVEESIDGEEYQLFLVQTASP